MIFLVRHGEAAAGWGEAADPGLSELGRAQAEAVAERLVEAGAEAAVSSPMRRCRETAAAFETRLGVSADIEPRVSEIATPAGLADRTAWLHEIMSGDWEAGGGSLLAWRAAALEAVVALPAGTAVFSHFVAINAIVGAIRQEARVLVFRPGHCSVTELGRDETGRLSVLRLGEEGVTRVL